MSTKRKIFIALGTFGALALVIVFLIILPLFRDIKNNSKNYILVKQEAFSIEEEAKNLAEIKEKYSEYGPDLNKIDSLFVNAKIPFAFTRFLEDLAKDSDVSLEASLSPSLEENKNQVWPAIYYQLAITGPFPNFSKFLEKLENSPYLIKIQNLTVKKLTKGDLSKKEFENYSFTDVKSNLQISVFTSEK
ncbi:MAG: hypothetical protein PHF44_01370 [Candidatus Pacebacteria bacterium]|nr:hypothetical protein [Candidatus Paceibacterota bacterium]